LRGPPLDLFQQLLHLSCARDPRAECSTPAGASQERPISSNGLRDHCSLQQQEGEGSCHLLIEACIPAPPSASQEWPWRPRRGQVGTGQNARFVALAFHG
uniref:Uncharacterized protein n=1 Tax=Gallus gallus TaxID=9031 RepID=A0A8V0XMH3_CHICK